MGPKNNKWWKCKDGMMVEYRERVMREHEDLDAENGTVEGEWMQYKDVFVGVAEELCGRTSGERRNTEKQKPRMVDRRGGEGSGGRDKREAWTMLECIKDRVEQPPTSLRHLYGQKKKAARWAVDRERMSMEEELYRTLDEYGG